MVNHSFSFTPTANAELLKFFGKCKDGKTRVLKVSIENGKNATHFYAFFLVTKNLIYDVYLFVYFFPPASEELRLVSHSDVKRDWEKDYDTLVRPLIEESTPCYILYR